MVQAKQKEQMSSRARILEAVRKNQPQASSLPQIPSAANLSVDVVERFKTILVNIGGAVVEVNDTASISAYIAKNIPDAQRIVSLVTGVEARGMDFSSTDPHQLENVDVAVLQGFFGVAENGAVWITDERMGDRALPFISAHLAMVIQRKDIVPTLHEAYERIGSSQHHFGTFIAGPSKTADIEQSLVLGAHGPKSMTVFIMS